MGELKSSLLEALESQTLDLSQMDELEEIIAPSSGGTCGSGGFCL